MKNKFTLIELLVVIAIIGILFSLLLPSLRKARFMAKNAVCASNLSQTTKALTLYTISNNRFYPAGRPINLNGDENTHQSTNTSRTKASAPLNTLAAHKSLGNLMGYDNQFPDWKIDIMQCPLGTDEVRWFDEQVINGTKRMRSLRSDSGDRYSWHSNSTGFYNMYFDLEGGLIKKAMRRLGDTFTRWSGPEEFNVIGSDVFSRMRMLHSTNRTTGIMTNHIVGGDRNWAWDDPGSAHFSYGPLYFNTTIGNTLSNWAFDDGSVKGKWRKANNGSGLIRFSSQYASSGFHIPDEFILNDD
jgi:prepilin-type N-terminal cleavage/methylation domain-containing protein